MSDETKPKVVHQSNHGEITPRLDSEPRVIETWRKRSEEQQYYEALKQAPQLDLNSNKYKDTGKVHHGDLQHAIDRTIAKQEAARGMPIDQVAEKQEVNLKGVQDERPKEFWVPPRIGRR